MNTKSVWFEEIENEFNNRKNIFSGYDVPDTFAEYIINNKLEKRNELIWKYKNDDESIKADYVNWLEDQFNGFNSINLESLDSNDELYPIYEAIAKQVNC